MINRSPYNGNLQEYLQEQRRLKRPLRDIAAEFGKPITHADIQRALKGEFPVGVDKRLALGLPAKAEVDICPKHGIVHCYDCETQTVAVKRQSKPRKWRDAHTPQGVEFFDMPLRILRAAFENREVIRE